MSADLDPVLVDTSIWIELLRHSGAPLRPFLDQLISEDRARLCLAVVAELIQGATTSKDLGAADGLRETIPMLEADNTIWLKAGGLGRRLRAAGVQVGLLDCYLAALAMEHGCAILSLDKHFPLIARHAQLKLVAPRPILS